MIIARQQVRGAAISPALYYQQQLRTLNTKTAHPNTFRSNYGEQGLGVCVRRSFDWQTSYELALPRAKIHTQLNNDKTSVKAAGSGTADPASLSPLPAPGGLPKLARHVS
jgi:hypothetical protein